MSRFSHARFLLSVASVAQFPPDHGVEVAFAGRSNAGKSSAINAVLARRALARTGKTPGQTRLLNYFELGVERRLVDLPGYGYARVAERERQGWEPLFARLRERRSLRGLFLIVDARRGIAALDLDLIDWAAPEARAAAQARAVPASSAASDRWAAPEGRRVHVLLTKADKLNRHEAGEALRCAREVLAEQAVARQSGGQPFSAQLFSASEGLGVSEAQRVLASWLDRAPETPENGPSERA